MSIDMREELARLARYMPFDDLRRLVALPLKLLPEAPLSVHPSVAIGADGPSLTAILLVTDSYLCEVRIQPTNDFDIIGKKVVDYRFRSWEQLQQVQKEGNTISQRLLLAEITLVHWFGMGPATFTALSYVGDDRDDWIQRVVAAIPISLVQAR